ncbi:MAG: hypothetical protein WCA22_23145, partial [Candidatus Binatus sp.]
MRLPNQRFPALPERINRPLILPILVALSFLLMFLAGCSGGTPSMAQITNFFTRSSPAQSPTPTATPTPPTVAPPSATPEAEEINKEHESRKTGRRAATTSKQPPNTSNQVKTSGANPDVSLENNPGATPAGARATPAAAASAASIAPEAGTPTLSPPASEASGAPGDANPAKAAKMIEDIDRIEKRVDRNNLSSDYSQRDILAQRLLQ